MAEELNLEKVIQDVAEGKTIGAASGIPETELDAMFEEATNMYSAENYAEAEDVFKALSILRHTDPRCWMGLAACRQARAEYAEAVDAYGMAAYMSGMDDLRPFLYGAKCHIALGDAESAESALELVLELEVPDTAANSKCRNEAEKLLSMIKKGGE